jgi:Flp pilus assembly protein protease CpaA
MSLLAKGYLLPLGLFLSVGLYSCYTDIRYRRIKNWIVAAGIIAGLGFGLFSSGPLGQKAFFLNLTVGVCAAIVLWRLKIWAPGDAKFFIFSSIFIFLLAPLTVPGEVGLGVPISIIGLLNAFLLAFTFLFLETTAASVQQLQKCWRNRQLFKLLEDFLNRLTRPEFILLQLKIIFFYSAAIIFFSAAMGGINKIVALGQKGYFIFYLILLLLYPALRRFLQRIKIPYLALILVLLASFLKMDIGATLTGAFKFFVVLAALRAFINSFIQRMETKTVAPHEFRPNMLPFVPFIVLGVIVTCLLEGRPANILFFL